MDGIHFVQAAFLGYLWCFTQPKSSFAVLRDENVGMFREPATRPADNITVVANDGDITAATVCGMLRKLSVQYAGRPIVIVPDNTRYQHYKLVEGLAKELGITLQFLPSYSPNLNWMERLWKFVKKKCLDNIYYETFDEFTSGINDCLNRVETDYQSEIDTFMKLYFQKLKKSQLMPL
jgi:transposase